MNSTKFVFFSYTFSIKLTAFPFTCVSWAPSQHPGQVVTCAEGNNGAGWVRAERVLADIVQALQDPSDGAVSTANKNFVFLDFAEDVQSESFNEKVFF